MSFMDDMTSKISGASAYIHELGGNGEFASVMSSKLGAVLKTAADLNIAPGKFNSSTLSR